MSDTVIGWRVWTDDGAGRWNIASSRAIAWADVSDLIIQLMLYFDDGTRRIMQGAEFYARSGDGSVGVRDWLQGPIRQTGEGIVAKAGKLVGDVAFDDSATDAMDSRDAP